MDEDASLLREKVQDTARHGHGKIEWLDALLAQHDERLRRNPLGGKEGVAREAITANAQLVKDDVETQIRKLFLTRVHELGVSETKKLFDEYFDLLEPQIKSADQWTRAPMALKPLWRERLREADGLVDWFFLLRPARKAVQAELVRGIKEVAKHLRNRYSFEASEEVRDCLQLAAARIGRSTGAGSEARGSYHDLLERFTDLQERTRGYLQARFSELCKDDKTMQRTRGMLEYWDAEKYDREIRLFLTKGADSRTYIHQVEKAVLAQLREQKGQEEAGKWQSVDSIGQLIVQVLPLNKAVQAPEAFVEEFARDLANACWTLLEGFCKDRSALELFDADPDQQPKTLDVLRRYSAPFLRRNSAAIQAEGADTVSLIQLGLANHTATAAMRFKEKLIRNSPEEQILAGLQAFSAQDDAIILCQEKHGLPLYYYQFLESMGRMYYNSPYQPERHFDFEFLKDRLPEIRKIDYEKQRHLGNCLELALQGIMTNILYWENGQYWLSYSTGQYAPRIPYPQGSRLESIVHRYAENALEREELTRQVATWIQTSRQTGEGYRLALLWCAVEDLVGEVSRRVALIRRSAQPGTTAPSEHPLVSILCSEHPDFKGLQVRLREQLGGLPNGARWLRLEDRPPLHLQRVPRRRPASLAGRAGAHSRELLPARATRPLAHPRDQRGCAVAPRRGASGRARDGRQPSCPAGRPRYTE